MPLCVQPLLVIHVTNLYPYIFCVQKHLLIILDGVVAFLKSYRKQKLELQTKVTMLAFIIDLC